MINSTYVIIRTDQPRQRIKRLQEIKGYIT